MPVELECKLRSPPHGALREKLRAAGASYVGRVLETNRLYDRADGSLRQSGRGLRIRSVEVLDGPAVRPTLTYKGPRTASAFKRREETEVEIGDAAVMAAVLAALGFAEAVSFEKRRESWRLEDCRIEMDELPELGSFVEVEGSDEQAIRSALTALGLSAAEVVDTSYVAMVAALLGKDASRPLVLRFLTPRAT
ncbi:MAG: class IV adenylate cyclase [Planctomycetota bacterium]